MPISGLFDKLASFASLSGEKKADLERVAEAKKAELGAPQIIPLNQMPMTAGEAYARGGQAAFDAATGARNEFEDNQWAESAERGADLARDLPLAVARTGMGLATGTGALLARYGNPMMMGLDDERNQVVESITDGGQIIDDFLKSGQSEISNRNEDIVGRRIAAKQQANREAQLQDEAAGEAGFIAGGRRLARDVLAGGAETLANPTELSNAAVGQVATLALGGFGKAGTLARAEAEVGKRVTAGQLLATDAAKAVEELAASKAKNQFAGVVGATEAGDVYQQTFHDINNTSIEDLKKNSPEFNELVDGGMDPNEARRNIANKGATIAAAIQAPIATAAGRLAAGFELDPLARGVKGTVGRKVGEETLNILKETGEEFIQGAGGALAENLGVKVTANKDQDLLDNVGTNAAIGAVTAGTMAAGTQAPALAIHGSAAVAKGTAKAVSGVVKGAIDRVDQQQQDEATATARETATAASENINAGLSTMQASHPEQAASIAESLVPSTDDSAVQSTLPDELRVDQAEGQDNVSALVQQVYGYKSALTSGRAKTPVDKLKVATLAANGMRKLEGALNQTNEVLASLPESDPGYAALVAQRDHLAQAVGEDDSAAVYKQFEDIDTETLDYLANLVETGNDDEVDSAVEMLQELAQVAPDKISAETAGTVLAHNIPRSPEAQRALEMAVELGETNEAAQGEREALIAETATKPDNNGKVSSISEVTKQIRTAGNKLNGKESLNGHIAGISRALAQNDMPRVEALHAQMGKFVNGLVTRAAAFAKTAEQLNAAKTGSKSVPGTFTLDAKGNRTNIPFVLHATSPTSMAVNTAVQIDAREAAKAFNYISKKIGSNESVAAPVAPSVSSASPAAQPDTTGTPVAEGKKSTLELKTEPQGEPVEANPSDIIPNPGFVSHFDLQKEIKDEFDHLEDEIGWEQRGGFLIRGEEKDGEGGLPPVVGRTKWVAKLNSKGEESTYWRNRENRHMTARRAKQALSKYRRGLRLGPAEKAFIEESIRYARNVAIDRMQDTAQTRKDEAKETAKLAPAPTKTNIEPTPAANDESVDDNTEDSGEAEDEQELEVAEDTASETMEGRFPALRDRVLPEGASDTLRMANQNQLLHGFQVQANSQSLLARLGAGPISKVAELAKKGIEGLKTLLPKGSALQLVTDDANFLRELFTDDLPAWRSRLNAMLQAATSRRNESDGKNYLEEWAKNPLEPKKVSWLFQDKRSLFATNLDPKGMRYDDNILDAMVLSGIQWAMNNANAGYPADPEQIAKFLKLDEGQITPALREIFQNGRVQEAYINDLANLIKQNLGVTAKAETSVSFTDGIPKALAGDVMALFVDQKLVTQQLHAVDEEGRVLTKSEAAAHEKSGGKVTRFATLSFVEEAFPVTRDKLGAGHMALNAIINPEAQQEWYIGAPPTNRETVVSGTQQKLSAVQKKLLANHQKIAFTLNKELLARLTSMGEAKVKQLLGYREVNESDVNKVDWMSIDGRNKGINLAWRNLEAMIAQIERHAVANNVAADEVPVHFDWYQTVNGRIMMRGIGPQANKLFREVLTPVKTTMDLGNPTHVRDFMLAIAQALGVKTENLKHGAAIAAMEKMFAEEGEFADVLDILRDPKSTNEEVFKALKATGKTEARVLNALHSYAMFQNAIENRDETLTQSMAFELDGKTDGPVNALGQFGVWNMSPTVLENLARGGYFFNDDQGSTLADHQQQGDLYGAVSRGVSELVNFTLGSLKSAKDSGSLNFRDGLRGALNLFNLIDGRITRTADGSIEVKRGFAKQPVTSTGYGGGKKSIVGHLRSEILDYFYGELTAAMNAGEPISAGLAASINALVTNRVYTFKDKKSGEVMIGTKNVRGPIDFSDVSKYQSFEFKKTELEAMDSHLKLGLADMLNQSINQELGSTLNGMRLVIKVSQLQWKLLAAAYEKAYEELRLQRVAEGKLLDRSALSRKDEKQLIKQLEALMPVFQTAYSEEGNSRDYGLGMVESGKRGQFWFQGKAQQTKSIFGPFASDLNKTNFNDPGLRAAALFNIGVGDANMMASFFRNFSQALNVWDGLEIGVGSITENSTNINEAVYKGWQYDAFGAVNQNLQRALPQMLELVKSNEELGKELVELFGGKDEEETGESLIIGVSLELAEKSEQTAAIKQAMGELGVSIDHMSGGGAPFAKEGKIVPQEELVAWINNRAAEIRKAKPQTSVVEKADANLQKTAAAYPNGMDRNAIIAMLDKHSFTTVQGYIWDKVKKLLPDNIVMHVGTAEEIAALQKSMYPDTDFGAANTSAGVFYGNTIFISVASPETMLHEALHAATYQLIRRYYEGGQLNDAQKAAIADLETLANGFLDLDVTTQQLDIENAAMLAQDVVRSHLLAGRKAEGVNEFMAWVTNQNVAKALDRKAGKISKLLQSVVAAVRKLFGLGNNTPVNTWLAHALSSITMLADNSERENLPVSGLPLFQQLPGSTTSSSEHAQHVEAMAAEFARKVLSATQVSSNLTRSVGNGVNVASVLRAFYNAGFKMSPREEHLFKLIQRAMSIQLKHDPRSMNLLQAFYEHVVSKLSPEAFMADPTSISSEDRRVAEAQYNAMLGEGTKATNEDGRSNLLANFLALSQTHERFRQWLATVALPEKKGWGHSPNEFLEAAASKGFDWLASAGTGVNRAANVKMAIDQLAPQLFQLEQEARRQILPDVIGIATEKTTGVMKSASEKALSIASSRLARRNGQKANVANTAVDTMLRAFAGLTSEKGAGAIAAALVSSANDADAPLFTWVRKLMVELVGTTGENKDLHALLSKVKFNVAHLRQRLRDELPDFVRGKFAQPLSKGTWAHLYRSLGRVDAQSLVDHFSHAEMGRLYADATYRRAVIATVKGKLSALSHGADYVKQAEALGHYLATQDNTRSVEFLYRNATAISFLPHLGSTMKDQAKAEPLIDQLVSLHAIEQLSPAAREATAKAFEDEAGMTYLLGYLKSLNQREQDKTTDQQWNRWKGYVPTTFDPRKRLKLASAEEGKRLERLGYKNVGTYAGDPSDVRGMSYYATDVGALATFNQGALQTTEGTILGVDYQSGRTLDPTIGSMIRDPRTVARITKAKMAGTGTNGLGLMPVFDDNGLIVAYERPLSASMREQHLHQVDDLAVSIGQWEGRIKEEQLAVIFNELVADQVHAYWQRDKDTKPKEYVAINQSTDKVVAAAWNNMPRHIQSYLLSKFDGPVMVRRDMLDNTIGYRSASVSDVFTGEGNLHPDIAKGIEAVSLSLMGKDAYRYLVKGEQVVQGLVSGAKDIIVVRSLVVGVANAVSNLIQLSLHGLHPVKAGKSIALALSEVNTYQRNIKRMNQISADLAVEKDAAKRAKLERVYESLSDANNRMMIAPLIEAGELPSIAEDLTEQDEFSITSDFTRWLEKQTAGLPDGVVGAAKWATVAKDTPLYQGMNRFIQYGDFVAKAALYNHMVNEQKRSKEEALLEISEEFVNYALLPGRSRNYLEKMGATWFLNYKIRIQKILARHVRRNPVRSLMISGGASLLGMEHLFKAVPSNIHFGSAFGPGQFFRAHDAIVWNQLFD
jgi:hypothetical protein